MIFISYLDIKSKTFQSEFSKINMNDISKDVSEKFRKLFADQQKKIQQQEEQIQRLKQREQEKARLFRAKEREKIQRLKQREQEKRQKAMEQIRQRERRKVQREIEKEERRRVKLSRDQLEKETKKWEREIRQGEKRRQKFVSNEPTFELIKTGSNANARFTTYFDSYRIKINKYPIDPADVFKSAMEKTINDRGFVVNDRVRLIVSHLSWPKPFSTKLLRITKGKNFIYNLIKAVLEFVEYKSVPLDELLIEVQSTRVPRGSGRIKVDLNNVSTKKSIICIKNNDTMCLARAIVTAQAHINKSKWTKSQLKDGFNKSRKLQEDEARKLHEEAGVEINDYGNTLEDVNTFAKHLGIQINIVSQDYFNEIIHTTDEDAVDGKVIYLHKNKNHYDVITSMTGFLCKEHYCHSCKKPYRHRDKHKCPSKSLSCFKSNSNCKGPEITCKDCNRVFHGSKCFNKHKRNRSKGKKPDIVCDLVKKCPKCSRVVSDLKAHVCGYSECSNCKEYCDLHDHKCYMLVKETKGGYCTRDGECADLKPGDRCLCCNTYTHNYMFYDLETQQDTGTHIVNYVNVQDFEGKEYTFDTNDEFCKFVFQKQHKNYTFIAHNAKSFDAQFVLRYCVLNGIKPFCIYNGTKIMYMHIKDYNIRFTDSVNFIQSRLEDFPKTFGLTEMKKGYFPHFFNVPENQDYVGPVPDVKYYGPDQMMVDKRKKFLKWHQDRINENYVFDFKKELEAYCRSDVDILRRSMLKFREDFITIANIDPLQYITIASVCMTVYRSQFMPANTIGIIKDSAKTETFSKISMNWLKWIWDTQNIYIQHALNGGEHVIPKVGKVDGFCKDTNTVYEFQGCFWHGCEKCYTENTINPFNQVEMAELKKRTHIKNQKITDLGYNLIEVYECEITKNSDFKKWTKANEVEIVTPLNPRDAFFGGRTNVTKLKYDFKDDEKGRYVDFVSLYPTVQYFKTYPVGHPTKILNYDKLR